MSGDCQKEACRVTHAPGSSYVCWTHRQFLPWSKPILMWEGCCCDEYGYETARASINHALNTYEEARRER